MHLEALARRSAGSLAAPGIGRRLLASRFARTTPIHRDFGNGTANFLETARPGFHTAAIRVWACCQRDDGLGFCDPPDHEARSYGARQQRPCRVPGIDNYGKRCVERPRRVAIRNVHAAGQPNYTSSKTDDPANATELETLSNHDQMTPTGENLFSTPPFFAAVAPILHCEPRMTATDPHATLNNGAADAAGR